jgi:hypothetical protein
MADTFKIGGKNVDKTYVYVGVGIVLVAGVYYYRKNKASSDAAAAQAQSVANAGSQAIDPATGYPYGSAEDQAALATQSNSAAGTGDGTLGGGYGYSGYSAGYGLSDSIYGANQPGSFTSNAQWAQYVEQYEVDTMGADAPTVGNAIGKYITGQPLTTDTMVSIVQSAISIGGYPPVNGPNGNPPGYITSSTTPTTPPTPTTTPTPGTKPAGAISNLAASVSGTTASIHWNSVPAPADGYYYVMSEVSGTIIQKGNLTQFATSISISGLKHGTTYNFGIQALPGGAGNNIHITVK